MRKMQKYVGTVFAALLLLSNQQVQAMDQIINLNFGIAAPEGQLVGVGKQNWNLIHETPTSAFPLSDAISNLSDSKGVSTNIGLSWLDMSYEKITNSVFESTPYAALMRSYVFSDVGQTTSMRFFGLSSGTYDLYVYSQSDISGQQLQMSVASSTGANMQATTAVSESSITTLSQSQNYLKFSNLAVNGNGWIDMTFTGVGTEDGYGVINGLQLTYTADVSPVPEPGSMVLLGIGGLVIFHIRYRKTGAPSVPCGGV